jgi:hypothetical protein
MFWYCLRQREFCALELTLLNNKLMSHIKFVGPNPPWLGTVTSALWSNKLSLGKISSQTIVQNPKWGLVKINMRCSDCESIFMILNLLCTFIWFRRNKLNLNMVLLYRTRVHLISVIFWLWFWTPPTLSVNLTENNVFHFLLWHRMK